MKIIKTYVDELPKDLKCINCRFCIEMIDTINHTYNNIHLCDLLCEHGEDLFESETYLEYLGLDRFPNCPLVLIENNKTAPTELVSDFTNEILDENGVVIGQRVCQ